jgi:Hydrolytic ATP binding site of dynein motor region
MVVPDFELICEIMLVAEGFLDARLLARKFITLYSLCKELLSKQVPKVLINSLLSLTAFGTLIYVLFKKAENSSEILSVGETENTM